MNSETRGRQPSKRDAGLEQPSQPLLKAFWRRLRRCTEIRELAFDVVYALRVLRRRPGFTIVAGLTLALGTGGLVATFSAVDQVLLRPLPFKDPDRLVAITHVDKATVKETSTISPGEFLEYRSRASAFESLTFARTTTIEIRRDDEVVPVRVARVSRAFFQTLGISPMAGRVFSPEDHSARSEEVAVVSYRFWMEYFNGDLALIGKRIGRRYTVIGIIPPGLEYPHGSYFWIPYVESGRDFNNYFALQLYGIGRLKPGVSVEQAETEVSNLFEQSKSKWWRPNLPILSTRVQPLHDTVVGHARQPLFLLGGAAFCVLLIACLNLANLFAAWGLARHSEMAVRRSLGAGQSRLVRQLFTESIIVVTTGVAAGVLIAGWTVRSFRVFAPVDALRMDEVVIDIRSLGFCVLLTFVVAMLCGVVPALKTTREGVQRALYAPVWVMPVRQRRLSEAFVAIQVAISLVLLTGAGLLFKRFVLLLDVNLGFEPARILTASTNTRGKEFVRRATERLRLLPSVRSAAAATGLPIVGPALFSDVKFEGTVHDPALANIKVLIQSITPDYFRTMGVPLRRGRLLDERDGEEAPRVAVVNEALARTFFRGQDPIGRRALDGPTIVGIFADVRNTDIASDAVPQMYLPYLQKRWWSFSNFVIRTTDDRTAASLTGMVRAELRALDKSQRRIDIAPLDARLAHKVAPQRSRTVLISAFAGLAILLAAIGIYGIVNYAVQQRTREFGVRIALGARPAAIASIVFRHSLWLVVAGIAVGVPSALVVTRGLQAFLFGVETADPLMLVTASLSLALVGLSAGYLPARRATAVDPVVALRHE